MFRIQLTEKTKILMTLVDLEAQHVHTHVWLQTRGVYRRGLKNNQSKSFLHQEESDE